MSEFCTHPSFHAPVHMATLLVAKGAFFLLASSHVYNAVDALQFRWLHLLLKEVGTSHVQVQCVRRAVSICCDLTIQMRSAVEAKNLGHWAKLMQERTTHLPHSSAKHRASSPQFCAHLEGLCHATLVFDLCFILCRFSHLVCQSHTCGPCTAPEETHDRCFGRCWRCHAAPAYAYY